MLRHAASARLVATALVLCAACAAPRAPRHEPAGTPAPEAGPGAPKSPVEALLDRYDQDRDGRVTRSEYGRSDAAFRNLDRDRDGVVTAADFERPVSMPADLAAPFLIVQRLGGPDADAIAIEDLPAAVARLDADGDNALSRDEFLPPGPPRAGPDRFAPLLEVADEDRDGRLALAEIHAWARARDRDSDGRISRRERLRPGAEPPIGFFPRGSRVPAPDFTLARDDAAGTITLSSFAGKRPVALIFGSFT